MPTCEGIHAIFSLKVVIFFFEEVVKTLDVFGSEGFSSQAFKCRKAVSVDDKLLLVLVKVENFFRARSIPSTKL